MGSIAVQIYSGGKIHGRSDLRGRDTLSAHVPKPKPEKVLRIASWNVRTLLDNDKTRRPQRRTAIVDRELKRCNIDIAVLSETRIHGEGSLQEASFVFYWIGHPQGKARHHGVGFAIKKELAAKMKSLPVGINTRIAQLRFEIEGNCPINIISAYAPTLRATDEEKESFYSTLSGLIETVPEQENIILAGDFNARVGRNNVAWKGVIGRHGLGNMNANGELLLSFCASHGLSLTNTMFQLKDIHKGTWMHPRSKHWHQLDYVITRRKRLNDVLSTRVTRSAECGTDHHMLITRMKIHTSKHKSQTAKPNRPPRLNIDRLHDSKTKGRFARELSQQISTLPADNSTGTAEDLWTTLKGVITKVGSEVLGKASKKKNPDWFNENSKEIEAALSHKTSSYQKLLNAPREAKLQKEFKVAKAKVLQVTRHAKNEWYLKKAAEIQGHADRHDSKAFFQAVKALYGPTHNIECPIKDANGTLLKNSIDIRNRWKEYYENLLNAAPAAPADVEKAVESLPQFPEFSELDAPPTLEEIENAVKLLKNGKAPGPDSLPAEIFKHGGRQLRAKLHTLFQKIWKEETVPKDFRDASVVNIYKRKGDRADCTNYRGISLLCAAGKILARIITTRLQTALEALLPESQAGFRPGRGTVDMMFAVRQVQEKIKEQNSQLYAVFIDLKKAFDMVHRKALWTTLRRFGCPAKLVNVLASLHEENEARVIVGGELTEGFPVTSGVRQGCVAAPLLFNVFMTAMLILVDRKLLDRGISINYRYDGGGLFNLNRLKCKNVSRRFITELQYADDLVLLAHTEAEVQQITDAFVQIYELIGMKVSTEKTKLLTVNVPEDSKVEINGTEIERVDEFCYLGGIVTSEGRLDTEISQRIRKAACAIYRLKSRVFDNRDLKRRTKIRVYRAVVIPTLLYGSETWTPYRAQVKALEKFHQRQLRKIMNIKWSDYISNKRVLEMAESETIERTLARNTLRWLGHVHRMPNHRTPKQLLYGELTSGHRSSGGQRKRFKDVCHALLRKLGIQGTWENICADRPEWRRVCHRISGIFDNRVQRSLSTDAPRETFTCDECGRTILSKIGLISHLRAHMRRNSAR